MHGDNHLSYETPTRNPRRRTRWWLILFLLTLTPFVLGALVFLLTLMGYFGGTD